MPTFQIYGVIFHWQDDKWYATYDKRNLPKIPTKL